MQMVTILFFHMVLRKSIENTCNKLILLSIMFFTNVSISFFNLLSDLFSIIAKKVDQIRNHVVCVVACHAFVFYCVLTTDHCNLFQHIFVNPKKSKFYGPCFHVISFDYDLKKHTHLNKI